jgi:hypothetical protein
MKTSPPPAPARKTRASKENAKRAHELPLRACVAAAACLKTAAEELAASWTALNQEVSTGESPTDLLRKRAWCNVLELRLKEQAHALEQARHAVDAVWNELMLTTRAREMFNRFLGTNATEAGSENPSLPLLARTASVIAGANRRSAAAKK